MTARASLALAAFAATLGVTPACLIPTGGERFSFDARAAGPADADGGTLRFTDDRGFDVALSRATLTLGPVYLDAAAPDGDEPRSTWWRALGPLAVRAAHAHGADEGQIVGEVLSTVTVELTRGQPVDFAARGTSLDARVRALRLRYDAAPTLLVEGRARGPGDVELGFRGALALDDAWLGAAQARRIPDVRAVTGVHAELRPTRGGSLLVRIDPRALLEGCDFASLSTSPVDPTDPTRRLLVQPTATAPADQVMTRLFDNLRRHDGVYDARWLAR